MFEIYLQTWCWSSFFNVVQFLMFDILDVPTCKRELFELFKNLAICLSQCREWLIGFSRNFTKIIVVRVHYINH